MGTTSLDTTALKFDFSDNTNLQNSRFYEIKVTQLPCTNEYKYASAFPLQNIVIFYLSLNFIIIIFYCSRFAGCFQYYEGFTGRVETFNYQNCGAQSHLPNQE